MAEKVRHGPAPGQLGDVKMWLALWTAVKAKRPSTRGATTNGPCTFPHNKSNEETSVGVSLTRPTTSGVAKWSRVVFHSLFSLAFGFKGLRFGSQTRAVWRHLAQHAERGAPKCQRPTPGPAHRGARRAKALETANHYPRQFDFCLSKEMGTYGKVEKIKNSRAKGKKASQVMALGDRGVVRSPISSKEGETTLATLGRSLRQKCCTRRHVPAKDVARFTLNRLDYYAIERENPQNGP